MLTSLTDQLRAARSLSDEQVGAAICALIDEALAVEIKAGFLAALAQKGETIGEITAFARGLREHSLVPPIDAATRSREILDVVGNSELEVNVKTPDARHLLNGFEKIANRVTTGIILAAMIVGAALMMRINSSFQIFGYPGIAMLCFLIALGGSGWLVLGILWKDYRDKHKRKE